ncbi:MAG TPA: ATP-binding protein, partial [Solirubrobacteraceae bacterium]
MLVGRARPIALLRNAIARSLRRCGGSVLIDGPPGAGRSRLLDACVLEAKVAGLNVIRADASDAQDGSFGVACALGRQLLVIAPAVAIEAAKQDLPVLSEFFPEHLKDTAPVAPEGQASAAKMQQALRQWFVKAAQKKPLLIAVDDLHLIDEQSGALLSLLATELAELSLVLVSTTDSDASISLGRQVVVKVLSEASTPCHVEGLDAKETAELLGSVFGDVPNVALVALRLHAIASGRPRDLMRLAQHLVDRGAVQYRNGTWSLPQHVESGDLPASLSQALQSRVQRLSERARGLAQTIAHVPELRLSFEECLLLTEHGETPRLIRSIDELMASEILRRAGSQYGLAESSWTAVLREGLSAEQVLGAHLRIARMCELRGDRFRAARHFMLGGAEMRGLDTFVDYARASQQGTAANPATFYSLLQSLPDDWLDCYELGLELCEKHCRPRRDAYELRSRLSGLVTINFVDRSCASELVKLLDQLTDDSGLELYNSLDQMTDPAKRLDVALGLAKARYEALPHAERVLEPTAAMRELARVVTEALGQIALSNDYALWKRLPSLAPFAPASPAFALIDLLAQGMGARLSGRTERAVERYRLVLERIADPNGGLPASHRLYTRLRVIGSIGIQEAVMGLPLEDTWTAELSIHPIYEMNALLLRMLHHLWQGDEDQAERVRRDAELLRIQNQSHQVFDSQQLMGEVLAYVLLENLTCVRRSIDALQTMEQSHVGWAAAAQYARGEYHRIRGDHAAALTELKKALELMQPCSHVLWAPACGAYTKALSAVERHDEAKTFAEKQLAIAERDGLGFLDAHLRLALASTLSALGEHDRAVAVTDAVIARFVATGTIGVNLAVAYEV